MRLSPITDKNCLNINQSKGEMTGSRGNLRLKLIIFPGDSYIRKDIIMAIKTYELRIVYDTETGEVEHLSEDFSDADTLSFEIDGRLIKVPRKLQKLIDRICDCGLAIS
tara:strand:- start:1819 stop:2145 length:327 start_codon:yes stop_codon:yes gene_type:complete